MPLKQDSTQYPRRWKGKISALGENIICIRSPWVSAGWSVTFPGFGHILTGQYFIGFILVTWEFFVNTHANLNTGILLTLTGNFSAAKEVLEPKWVILYVAVYLFSIWDSYRSTVELNKYAVLADAENIPIIPSKVTSFSVAYSDKRHPWLGMIWSIFTPGLGNLYAGNIIASTFAMIWFIALAYLSNLVPTVQYTLLGEFAKAKAAANPQWLLYAPSAYAFIVYSTYVSIIEYNSLFDAEQGRYLKTNYQNPQLVTSLQKLFTRRKS